MDGFLSRSITYMALLTFLSITSCGKRNPPPEGKGVKPPGFGLGGNEFQYKWEDQDCIDGAKLGVGLTTAVSSSWAESMRKDINLPLEGIINSRGEIDGAVFSPQVSARTRFSRECANDRGEQCLDNTGNELGFTSVSPGDQPKFCRQGGNYGIDSIERVTLTSAVALKHALDFASSVYTEHGAIPKVHLLVLPRFETVTQAGLGEDGVRRDPRVIVNGLAYFPTDENSNPFIAVFPRDVAAKDEVARLWEAPFVFGHELGHHIERYLRVDRYANTNRSVVRAAVSEAFADLYGYASDGLDDTVIRNIPCMGTNRAVGSGVFSDTGAKIFDRGEIDTIESHNSQNTSLVSLEFENAGCGGIAKYEYHGIGAIFAHNVHSILAIAFDLANVAAKNRGKSLATASAAWLKETDRLIGSGSTPRKDIIASARALETVTKNVLNQYNISLTDNVADAFCQRMLLGFSGTEEKTWFGRTCTKSTHLME